MNALFLKRLHVPPRRKRVAKIEFGFVILLRFEIRGVWANGFTGATLSF